MKLILLALLTTGMFPAAAAEPISMTVSPLQSMAPTDLSIRLRVENIPDARLLRVIADSGTYLRSSEIQLSVNHPRTTLVEFKEVPGGNYDVLGVLTDGSGREIGRVQQRAVVVALLTDH